MIMINGFDPETIINDLDAVTLAVATNVTQSLADWMLSPLGMNLPNKPAYTLREFLTRRCDSCGEPIQLHDSAKWRIEVLPIRHVDCAKQLFDSGVAETWFDAHFVL